MRLEADLAVLHAVADKVEGAARSVGAAFEAVSGALTPTGGSAEWAATAAAATAATAWEDYAPQLRATVQGLATGLRSAADDIAEVDAESAARIGRRFE